MLDDRHYMRPDYRPRRSLGFEMSLTMGLLISLVVAFVLQFASKGNGAFINDYLALSPEGLRHGYLWELLTFQFLHAGIAHLAFNLLSLWWLGRLVEDRLGKAHFLKIYFLGGMAGGLLQTLLMWQFPLHFGTYVVGASAGICSLIAAYAIADPDATFVINFLLPMRAKILLYIAAGISLAGMIWPSGNVAHGAHLGGILFAVGYMRWGYKASYGFSGWNPFQRKTRGERLIKTGTMKSTFSGLRGHDRAEEPQELPSGEFISKEVDPILDKISAHGIQSLTDRERRILQAARAKMSKR